MHLQLCSQARSLQSALTALISQRGLTINQSIRMWTSRFDAEGHLLSIMFPVINTAKRSPCLPDENKRCWSSASADENEGKKAKKKKKSQVSAPKYELIYTNHFLSPPATVLFLSHTFPHRLHHNSRGHPQKSSNRRSFLQDWSPSGRCFSCQIHLIWCFLVQFSFPNLVK